MADGVQNFQQLMLVDGVSGIWQSGLWAQGESVPDGVYVLGIPDNLLASGNSSYIIVQDANTEEVLHDVVFELSGSDGGGAGPYAINQDGGTGAGAAVVQVAIPSTGSLVDSSTDCMRFVVGSVGISGIPLTIFLKSDFDAGLRNALAQTATDVNGRWASALMLGSGDYYLVADAVSNGYQGVTIRIIVP